eukprot:jgi/Bigna1/37840/e_gw1.22.6.1
MTRQNESELTVTQWFPCIHFTRQTLHIQSNAHAACSHHHLRTSSGNNVSEAVQIQRAKELRVILEELGPTFVKVGQALALRPDIVRSSIYLRELETLQDAVGTFPTEKALEIIEKDLGAPPDTIYEFLSPMPVASASIGQVYRAKLREPIENVTDVAVKVQRPDALKSAAIDLFFIRRLAAYAKKTLRLNSDLVGIIDEFGRALFEEMDYTNEAQNCRQFAELYRGIEDVVVPSALPSLTSRRVLTMEWLEGEKGPWDDGQRMVEIGLECSISQILSQGYFHADPHRGNLIRTREGKLGYLDFGLMATVDERKRNAIVAAAVGLQNQEWGVLAENMQIMGFFPAGADVSEYVEPLRAAFIDAQGGDEKAGPRSLSLGKLAGNIQGLARQYPIRIPPWYSIILRTLLILEGLALSRDRDFKLLESAYPYIIRVLLKADSPDLQRTLKDVILYPNNGTLRWPRVRKLLALRTWSSETVGEAMNFFFSPEGKFLREPLTSEIIELFDLAQLEVQKTKNSVDVGWGQKTKKKKKKKKKEGWGGREAVTFRMRDVHHRHHHHHY